MALYSFGPFVLDPATRQLSRDEQSVPITAKVLETLIVLVQNRGRVLSKDELLSTLWPDAAVEEANLAQVICSLRRALEDHPKEHRYIATIPGRGYVFVGAVAEVAAVHDGTAPCTRDPASVATVELDAVPSRMRFWVRAAPGVALLLICSVGYIASRLPLRKPPSPPSVPLVSFVGSAICPSFAPDGDRVAFAWDGERRQNFNLYVKQIGAGPLLRLTSDPGSDLSPAWSPDGREIAFLRSNAEGRADVLLIPSIAPGAARRLTTVTAALNQYRHLRLIAWSRDSKWLVVPDGPSLGGMMGLFLLSRETGEKRRLTRPPAKYDDLEPAFSPDMRQVAFVRYAAGDMHLSELYVVHLSENLEPLGSPERLTFFNRHAASPVWLPNGRALLFTRSDGTGGESIWRIDLTGSHESEPVGTLAERISGLDVSREGNRIVYARESSKMNIYAADLHSRSGGAARNKGPKQWISSGSDHSMPQFAPDGKLVAFQSGSSEDVEIWVGARDGTDTRQVTAIPAVAKGLPRWSPDGKSIVFECAQGSVSLCVVNADGGTVQPVLRGDGDGYAPSWSHDGRWIYFTSRQTGERQIWKVPSRGGSPIQVTRDGGSDPTESDDGSDLFS